MEANRQTTGDLLLIRPALFAPNRETAVSNPFQSLMPDGATNHAGIAVAEFDNLVECLQRAGARPLVFADTPEPPKPDAVFPNNWVSFHGDGTVVLYPMEAPSRRPERRIDIVNALIATHGFDVRRIVDLSGLENQGAYLEGTGSLVLDRVNRVAYAGLSGRTHRSALAEFARQLDFEVFSFETSGPADRPIYHTNVMMSIGESFAVVCAEVVPDPSRRRQLLRRLAQGRREVIEIDVVQLGHFAGNLLEVQGASGPLLLISRPALDSLAPDQRSRLQGHAELLPVPVDTIEQIGGGSVRCMLAEIHLPRALSGAFRASALDAGLR